MKSIISVNEEAIPYIKEMSDLSKFKSTLNLLLEFDRRGHDLIIIHPRTLQSDNDEVRAPFYYEFRNGKLERKGRAIILEGNLYYVNHVGEDSLDLKLIRNHLNLLGRIERNVVFMVNNAESNSFRLKSKQKRLPIPWIPYYGVSSHRELEELVGQGKKIIMKPKVGSRGLGVKYLEGLESIGNIPESGLDDFIYEEYLPEKLERRYVFLNKDIIATRVMEKVGPPSKEVGGNKETNHNPSQRELDIVKKVIDLTGMFYGSVDFRQGYVLEINSSSTSVTSGSSPNNNGYSGELLYNLSSMVLDVIEDELSKK